MDITIQTTTMADDIIDIITRLSYQIDDDQLQRATNSVSQQIKQIDKLETEIKALTTEFSKTADTEVRKRDEIMKKIVQNRTAVKQLNTELGTNILRNKDLQAVLQKEQGLIGSLNTQLTILRQKRDAATDAASIRGYNKQITAIGKELASLSDEAGSTHQGVTAAFGSLTSLAALAGVAFTVDGVKEFGKQVLEVTAKYEKFKAVLTNTLGSKGAAEASFRLISDYAKETPYQVDEITESFIKLVNRGIIPTKKQLTQIGDLAASQGKPFDQLVEAILDAQTGEFERLKEFGIIAKQSGDKVTLSFKDQTVTVKKNTEAIRDAILSFGDLNGVMGSTESISNTLEGRISNLSDAWDRFLYTLGKNIAPATVGILNQLTKFVEAVNGQLDEIGGKDLNTRVAESEKVQALFKEFGTQPADVRKNSIDALEKQLQGLIDTESTKIIPLEQRLEEIGKQLRASFLGDKDLTAEGKRIKAQLSALANVRPTRKIFESIIQQLRDQDTMLSKVAKGTDTGTGKTVENVYLERLQSLKSRLASLRESIFQSDDTIRAKISESIEKDQVEINKLLGEGKLTGPQAANLRALLGTIKKEEIDKALKEFGKARLEAQKKIDDQLNSLILEDAKQRTELIRDEFERQTAALDVELTTQTANLTKAREELLKNNQESADKGLISKAVAQKNADEIKRVYESMLTALGIIINKKKAELSLTLFDTALQYDKTFFGAKDAEFSEQITNRVTVITRAYLNNTISFKRYQKELTKIQNEETNKRRKLIELPALENELDITQRKLEAARASSTASDSDINAIQDRVNVIRQQIAELNRLIAEGDVSNKKSGSDIFIEKIKEKIGLFKSLSDAGVEAYQAIGQAQEDQVNRDIENQQRRVDRAQAIADRGNAKALQQEEERLNKLQKEREKFAQTQLAINAAQTLSSSILAIATAAGETGAGAIVVVPAVIAALAAGFAAVKALSTDSQGFRDGVVDLRGPGTPTSDSIPANLSRGESVVTAAGTAKHKEILEGMNAGKQYRVIGDKLLEMSQGTGLQMLQSAPVKSVVVVNNGGGQADKKMLKRLEAIEQAVLSKPTQSWHLDRRGFVAMYQDEINFQDKMKKL